jgi:hypothetical protein
MPLDIDDLSRNPAVAGVAGSLVALRFSPGETWGERLFNFICGSLCAILLAPAVAEFLSLTSHAMLSGLSFAIGLFGLSIAAALSHGLKGVNLAEVITGWIGRKD